MLSRKILPTFILSLVLFGGATAVLAAEHTTAAPAAPAAPEAFCLGNDFYTLITQFYNIGIGIAILSAIFMLVYGGYRLVVSIGLPAHIASGKKAINNAIIGLIIAVLSAVILNILNPQILTPTDAECAKQSGERGPLPDTSPDPNQ
ncbi:MAG: pilin [bacterium]|nr:pilin [bacterium]